MSAAVEVVLERYADAKNRHDVEAALDLCTEDSYYESVGLPGRVQGKEALRAFFTGLFEALPDYRADFEGRAISGDTSVVWGTFGGTVSGEFMGFRPTGSRIEVPVTFVTTFRDGLVASDVGYFDVDSIRRQAGGDAAADWVRRFEETWAAPAPERLADLVHEDVRLHYPFAEAPLDRAGMQEYWSRVLEGSPDLRLEVRRWAAAGDDVFIEWTSHATIGGEPFESEGVDRFTIRGDRAAEGFVFTDTHVMREAMASARTGAAA